MALRFPWQAAKPPEYARIARCFKVQGPRSDERALTPGSKHMSEHFNAIE